MVTKLSLIGALRQGEFEVFGKIQSFVKLMKVVSPLVKNVLAQQPLEQSMQEFERKYMVQEQQI